MNSDEKSIKRAFRRHCRNHELVEVFVSLPAFYAELVEGGMSPEDALNQLMLWFSHHLRKFGVDGQRRGLAQLRQMTNAHPDLLSAVGFTLVGVGSSLPTSRRKEVSELRQLVLMICWDFCFKHVVPRELRILAATKVLDSTKRAAPSFWRTDIVQQRAVLRSQLADPLNVDVAVTELEEAVSQARQLVESNSEHADELLGRCLYNLAHTLRLRTHGDRIADLKRAENTFTECLGLPVRKEDPGAFGMTAQSYGATIRLLVPHIEDRREALSLFEESLELLNQAIGGLSGVKSPRTKGGYDPREGRESLWQTWANMYLDYLLLRTESGSAEGSEFCSLVLDWLPHTSFTGAQRAAFAHRFSIYLSVPSSCTVEEFRSRLRDIRDECSSTVSADVAIQLDLLLRQRPKDLPSDLILSLSALLDRVDPLSVGAEFARSLFVLEGQLLAEHKSEEDPEANELVDEIWGRVSVGVHLRIVDPQYSLAERQVLGFRRSQLARALVKLGPLSSTDELRLFDFLGANAYRADLQFFGGGEVGDSGRKKDLRDLYWARVEHDQLGFLSLLRELMAVYPGERIFLESVYATERVLHFIDGQHMTPRDLDDRFESTRAATMREVRVRFADCIEKGLLEGSEGPGQFMNPKCAVIAIDPSYVALHVPEAKSSVLGENLPEIPDLLAELAGAITEFAMGSVNARNAHEFYESSVSHAELTERWRQHAEKIGLERDIEGHHSLNSALRRLSEALKPIASAIAKKCSDEGVRQVAILSRGGAELIPWEMIPVKGDNRLGDVLDCVRVPTLLQTPRSESECHKQLLQYVGEHEGKSPELLAGRLVMETDGSEVTSGLGREELENELMEARVVRMFTHGQWTYGPHGSGLHFGETESNRILEDGRPHTVLTAGEIKSLDLRGCQRVELWACESARNHDLVAQLSGVDEPTGIASAFLLAGADRVLGSWWPQPIGSATIICAYFKDEVADSNDAFDDSRALSAAVARYRSAVAPGGPFESAALRRVNELMNSIDDPELIHREALGAGWNACLTELAVDSVAENAEFRSMLGGFEESSIEEMEMKKIRNSPIEVVHEWLEPWRGPAAWAGWRVVCRDGSSLEGS